MMALLLLMLAATLGEAKTRDWKDAKVTDVSETIVSAASWGDTNIRHYTIETDDISFGFTCGGTLSLIVRCRMKPLSPTRSLCVSPRAPYLSVVPPNKFACKPLQRPYWPYFLVSDASLLGAIKGRAPQRNLGTLQPRPSPQLNLHNSPRPPQPRTATSKRLNRTRCRTSCTVLLLSENAHPVKL